MFNIIMPNYYKAQLITLSSYLLKNALEEEAKKALNLWEGSENIDEDWDVSKEERRLNPSLLEVDKIIRDTSPRPGWFLPHDDLSKKEKPDLTIEAPWIMEDVAELRAGYNKNMDPEDITSEFVSAIKSAGDGSRPRYVGHGVFGVVWDIGNDRLVKIYDLAADEPAAALSREMIFENIPFAGSELMVLSMGRFNASASGQHKGWKIMERLINSRDMQEGNDTLFSSFNRLVMDIRSRINSYRYFDDDIALEVSRMRKEIIGGDKTKKISAILNDPNNIETIMGASRQVRDYLSNEVGDRWTEDVEAKMIKKFDLDKNWLNKLAEHMIILYITGRADTGVRNLGLRPSTGTFVYFDA